MSISSAAWTMWRARPILAAFGVLCATSALAQQLDVRFSCSAELGAQGDRTIHADNGTIRLDGSRIEAFQWESAIFDLPRSSDCSIDESDGLQAEYDGRIWRIALQDGRAARMRRGYTYGSRFNCSIRLEREGDSVRLKPACPALCGLRGNFSELSVNLKTGDCRYEDVQ